MTTTIKHRKFAIEPMGKKSVTELPGIGDVLGKRLQEKGIKLASRVLGQYLVFDKDETKFKEWLKEQSGGTAKHCTDCYNGLKDWDDRFL